MNISLLIIGIIATVFSGIMGYLVFRQVYKSRWVDARAMRMFWVFLIVIILCLIGIWTTYFLA